MGVRALFFEVRDVGKRIKKSKKYYLWKFEIDGSTQILELFNSQVSGKKKVVMNGRIVCERKQFKGFQFSTTYEKSLLNIVQVGDHYELRINNQSFDFLYGAKKSSSVFKQDSEVSHKPPTASSGWRDVEDVYKSSLKGPSISKPKTDYEESKITSLAAAFSGLSVKDFGAKDYEGGGGAHRKPDFKQHAPARISLPKQEKPKAEGWGDGAFDFKFEDASSAAAPPQRTSGVMAPPKTQKPPERISAPTATVSRREPPKQVVQAPPPPPAPAPVQRDLLDEEYDPQSKFDINRLSDLKFETPAMAAERAPGLAPSRPLDILNQLYENTPVKQQQEQQKQQQQAATGGFDLLGGDEILGGGEGAVQLGFQPPKDDLWGNNNLVNIDNIEDENTNKSNQGPISAFPGVPMSEMNYETKKVSNFEGNPSAQHPIMQNPVMMAMGMNPFAMQQQQMMGNPFMQQQQQMMPPNMQPQMYPNMQPAQYGMSGGMQPQTTAPNQPQNPFELF